MSRFSNTVVACYSLDGELVKVYKTAKDAAISRHLFIRTIDRCVRGDISTVKGLQWKRYKVDEVPSRIPPLKKETTTISIKPVAKIDDNEVIIEVYPSIRNAATKNNIGTYTLRDILNKKYAYDGKAKYRYLSDNEITKYKFKNGHQIDNKTKAVIQYSLDDKYIKTYPSISEANIALNKAKNNQGISKCLKGIYLTAFGYKWKYKDQPNVSREKKTYIYALDDNHSIVKRYNSVKEASIELGVNVSSINNAIRLNLKVKGYHWKRS